MWGRCTYRVKRNRNRLIRHRIRDAAAETFQKLLEAQQKLRRINSGKKRKVMTCIRLAALHALGPRRLQHMS